MSLSKKDFDRAKQKANERLTGWISNIKQQEDFGIPKLQREFVNTFKKIEYIPKDIVKIDGRERKLSRHTDEKQLAHDLENSGIVGVSAVTHEDHHDSNSSNLSSRLENIKDESKITESRTPFDKTPLLLTEPTDSKDTFGTDTVKPSETQTTLNAFLQSRSKRRTTILPGILPGFLPFAKKRRARRARKSSLKREKTVINRLGALADTEEAPDENEEIEALAKKSSTLLATQRYFTKTFKPSKGPTDLLTRRLARKQRTLVPSKHDIVTLTTEEKRAEILSKFRRYVRLLIHVRVLLKVSRIRIQEEEKSKSFKRYDGGLELSFDATQFKSAISYSGLTSRAKNALKKNPRDRTEEDAKILMEVLLRLPMFMKYSKAVKQALAYMVWYDTFKEGRVIVKQDDPGTRMYFVISGEEISYHIRTVQAGATFGELALIRNIRREFTAICRGTSEFLSLSKDEFNHALRSRWERDCNKRFNFLRSCEHFSSWTDKQLQFCADSSQLKEYMDNNVIIGDIDGQTDSVYFIRSGRCEIVRRLVLVRHQSPYQRPNILLPPITDRRKDFLNKPYCRNRRIDQQEVRFLSVTSLHPGNYFGAGESLRDTYILARGKTELLVINSAQFSIQGKSEQLRRLKREREISIPSNKALYNKFQQNRKWFEYRNTLLKDILSAKVKPYTGSLRDVPRSILTDPTIPNDLVFYKKRY